VTGAGSSLREGAAHLALFVVLALLTRAPFLTVPFLDLDEAAALVGSWTLLDGGTLYVDFVDNRPPLLYHLYALGQVLFGRGMVAVRLMTALVVLPLTALAASAFFRHDRRGFVAGILYLVYGAAFLAHDMHAVSAEVLMLLPLGGAVALLRSEEEARRPGRVLAAGVLVGLAALVRQHALLWLPALALVVALASGPWARRVGGLLLLGAGAVVPLVTTVALFARLDAASDLAYWTLTHNLGYAANPIPAAEALERAVSYLLPFLIVTAPLWWAGWESRALFDSRHSRLLVASLVALSLPAVFVGFRFFPHYFIQLYLPLALAAAPCTASVLTRPLSSRGRVAVAWPAVLLAGFTAANLFLYRGGARVYTETSPVFREVAVRLREDPCAEGGALFVWGYAPQFYAEAALARASRFVVPQASLAGYVPGNRAARSGAVDTRSLVSAEHWGQLMADLEATRPVFILDTSPSGLYGWDRYPLRDFPALEGFVRAGYRAVAEVDGVWIWRRKGCEVDGRLGTAG
jgi:4-amino-4-deoxy-L-arabinose transferase-like glycosyltransferase